MQMVKLYDFDTYLTIFLNTLVLYPSSYNFSTTASTGTSIVEKDHISECFPIPRVLKKLLEP